MHPENAASARFGLSQVCQIGKQIPCGFFLKDFKEGDLNLPRPQSRTMGHWELVPKYKRLHRTKDPAAKAGVRGVSLGQRVTRTSHRRTV